MLIQTIENKIIEISMLQLLNVEPDSAEPFDPELTAEGLVAG